MLLALFSASTEILADAESRAQDEVVVVFSEYRPYQYLDNGKPQGPKVKILSHLISELGFRPTFKFLPWKRALYQIEQGEADLITAQRSPDRETYMNFVNEPLWNVRIVAIRKKGLPEYFTGDISSLFNFRIGVVNGYSYGKKFDQAAKAGKFRFLTTTKTTESLVRMLMAGRIDVFVSNEAVANATAGSLGVAQAVEIDGPPLRTSSTNIAISRKTPYSNLHKRMSNLLNAMKSDGRYTLALQSAFSFQEDY